MPDPITAVLAGSAILGAGANIFGAQSAADAQKQAAAQANAAVLQQQQQGLAAQKGYFDTGNAPLSTIANKGVGDYTNLEAAIPGLTAPITMDQATLEATPGYQFNLSQGERGVSLGAAAAGLSGAQAKAAAKYATGLADSTYQNQFNNANTNKQNAYNFLLGTANLGTSAAGQYGLNATAAGNADISNSQQVGSNISSNTIGAGNAQAAADIATGKNVGNALTSGSTAYASTQNPFGNYGMYGAVGSGNPATTINYGGNSYPAYS
jgi:hypothetical protein